MSKLILLCAILLFLGTQGFPDLTVSPTPTPSLGISGSPDLTPAEAKSLLKEFQKAQKTELKALEHQNSVDFKGLKSSQKARMSNWLAQEQAERHKYFEIHKTGPERRQYVQEFIQRRKDFQTLMSEEYQKKSNDQATKMNALKYEQGKKLKEFMDSLKEMKRPDLSLWPESVNKK